MTAAAAAFYWHAFADGFHAVPWIAVVTIALFAVGLVHLRRFSPGGRAVFALAAVAFAGVAIHPQIQGRFLTSWLFAVWIGAGAGGAVLLERLVPRRVRLPVAGLAAAVLALASWRETPPAAYAVAIHPSGGPSDLAFVRPLLPDLDGARTIAVATTFGSTSLWVWAIRERCRCRQQIELAAIDGPWSRDDARTGMAAFIAASPAEVVAIVDAPAAILSNCRSVGPMTEPSASWMRWRPRTAMSASPCTPCRASARRRAYGGCAMRPIAHRAASNDDCGCAPPPGVLLWTPRRGAATRCGAE